MWASGAAVVRGVHSVPIDLSKAGCVAATESLLRRHISAAYWEGDTLTFRIDTATVQAIASKAVGEQCIRGTFCHEWLEQWQTLRDLLTWIWHGDGTIKFELQRSRSPAIRLPVQSRYDCELRARADINKRDFRFHDHPALSRLVQLHTWANWRFNRARYKEAVSGQRVAQGTVERDRAIAVQATNNKDLHDALSQLDWRDIRAVRGAGASTVQTLFRLKANKLKLWNYVHSDRSCPHGECPRDVPISLQHVFRECPIAKAAWKDFDIRWRRLGDNVPANLIESCFSLGLDDTPTRAWRTVCDHVRAAGTEHCDVLYEVSRDLWRLTVAATIQAIWCARLRLRHEPDALQSTLRAAICVTVDNALRDLVSLSYKFDTDILKLPKNAATRALADRLKGTIDGTILSPPIRDRSAYVLFFMAARVVIPVQADPVRSWSVLIWTREHQRLPGRRACHMRITAQPTTWRNIGGWSHHYRANNKMADLAANIAMDSKTSQQTCATDNRPLIARVQRFLRTDVHEWQAFPPTHTPGPSISALSAVASYGRRVAV
uniref:Reverse transcriptase n=1 Tax=Peronospora matthiolae TaxID=2874970 RepID=A0AAV1ULH0_9STRA